MFFFTENKFWENIENVYIVKEETHAWFSLNKDLSVAF